MGYLLPVAEVKHLKKKFRLAKVTMGDQVKAGFTLKYTFSMPVYQSIP